MYIFYHGNCCYECWKKATKRRLKIKTKSTVILNEGWNVDVYLEFVNTEKRTVTTFQTGWMREIFPIHMVYTLGIRIWSLAGWTNMSTALPSRFQIKDAKIVKRWMVQFRMKKVCGKEEGKRKMKGMGGVWVNLCVSNNFAILFMVVYIFVLVADLFFFFFFISDR